MSLQSLVELIETLRQRMRQYEERLRKSEALTRYVLIDPILRALGWNTENPDQVEAEFPTPTGRSDYTLLLGEGWPFILIEAKAFLGDLQRARQQGFERCQQSKARYYVVTNGNTWEFYERV